MPNPKPSFIFPVAAALALLLALYLGAYYAMAAPLPVRGGIWVTYRGKFQGWEHSFFGPAHILDRRIRPDLWNR
ncbi:MAG: hypothetical protein IT428_09185 [Planctomycetaceae bacterium]|nr:hypothetical protein [Planctomycetaceae bacterium]